MNQSFYNTTHESGKQLAMFIEKAKTQEIEILLLMQHYEKLSASDVHKYFPKMILTSIRRGLTNLTTQGFLVKTDEKKLGEYGRNEYIYRSV